MTPSRVMFWQIDHVWIFYVAGGTLHGAFPGGFGASYPGVEKSAGSKGVSFSADALKKMLLDAFLGGVCWTGDAAAGLMHLLIFWGFLILFIGTGVLSIHHYLVSFSERHAPPGLFPYHGTGGSHAAGGDPLGACSPLLQRVPRLERRLEDALVPLWLLLMVLSGFILEGARLSALQPAWGNWSFVGLFFRGVFPPPPPKPFILPSGGYTPFSA
jgi:hypothetical protein